MAATGSGREELRAALLRPYLLHLELDQGPQALAEVLAAAGVRRVELEHESMWLSVSCALRLLRGLSSRIGEENLATRGRWATHPGVLSGYVRLLRAVKRPIDAYRQLAEGPSESSRIGSYELGATSSRSASLIYRPRSDSEAEQANRLLCLVRQAELRSLPRLWGLPEAELVETSCLGRGALTCRYEVRWAGKRNLLLPLGAALGAAGCGAAVALSGNVLAAGIATGAGAALGSAVGALAQRLRTDTQARTLERHRIAALEHGLDQRGQLVDAQGALTSSVLGGKYRILRKIGSGGIGAVYAAEHLGLGTQVAVKVLRGAAAADAGEIARLRREARVQVSIEHPNVVRTLDLDQMPDGSIYVVMELLEGMSLQEHLATRAPLPPGVVLPHLLQVCRALSAAHRLGIVHRDLKPGNVFICHDDTVKVLDFGMSKLAEADALTQDGYTLGTPEYMSPEQCVGAPVDARSDIYAFGVLTYEALTGELPLYARTRRDLLEMHQRTIPKPLRERRPELDLPEELDRVVMACLKKRAAERPESAQHLERLLASISPQSLVYQYPPDTPHTSRPPRVGGVRRGA